MTLTNQRTSILILVPGYDISFKEHLNMIVSNDGSQAFFSPFGFPIHGKYDDYGHLTDIKRDKNVEMLEEYFGVSIDDILQNIGRKVPVGIKNEEFYKTLGITYFRTEVLEHLESGWGKVNLTNPKAYTTDHNIKKLLDMIGRGNRQLTPETREEYLKKFENKTITEEEKAIFLERGLQYVHADDLRSGSVYEFNQNTYITSLCKKNMFSTLPITIEFKTDIIKQHIMLESLYHINKNLIPSNYGSQQDNWVEIYKLNELVNDLIAADIEERAERWGEDVSKEEDIIIKRHKRDRVINSILE